MIFIIVGWSSTIERRRVVSVNNSLEDVEHCDDRFVLPQVSTEQVHAFSVMSV